MVADHAGGRIMRLLLPDGPRNGGERLYVWSVSAALFLFPFSLVFIACGLLPAGYGWTATVTIVLYALVMLASELRAAPARSAVAAAAMLVVSFFAIEWIAVNTGVPFGSYSYTEVLQPLVAGVPLAIAAAWYSTLTATRQIARWMIADTPHARMRTAVLAGLLTLALDLVLEPFAAFVNGYWLWSEGRVPLQNYGAWFVLSVAAVWLLSGGGTTARRSPDPFPAVLVYALQFTLFAVTAAVQGHGIYVAAGILVAGPSVLAFGWRTRFRPRGGAPRT